MRADAALALGSVEIALGQYREAAAISEDAFRSPTSEPTEPAHALLISNAAVLWYKAGEWERAERVAGEMLSRGPASVRGTLRQVLLACWQARSHAEENSYFTPVELKLDGEAIGFGLAPVDEVTIRQDTVQSLLWRTSELVAGIPYRRRGAPGPEVRRASQVFAAAAAPGSYRIMLRVRSPWTQADFFPNDLPPEARVRGGEPLVHRAIELASAIANGGKEVAKLISDPLYRIGLSQLVRDLAPDGKRVTDVRLSGGTAKVVAEFSGSVRSEIAAGIRAAYDDAGLVEITGKLTGMKLLTNDLQIVVHDHRKERDITLTAPQNAGFEEKVGPLWGRRVLVAAGAEGKRLVMQDIEAADLATELAETADEKPRTTSTGAQREENETQGVGVSRKRRDD